MIATNSTAILRSVCRKTFYLMPWLTLWLIVVLSPQPVTSVPGISLSPSSFENVLEYRREIREAALEVRAEMGGYFRLQVEKDGFTPRSYPELIEGLPVPQEPPLPPVTPTHILPPEQNPTSPPSFPFQIPDDLLELAYMCISLATVDSRICRFLVLEVPETWGTDETNEARRRLDPQRPKDILGVQCAESRNHVDVLFNNRTLSVGSYSVSQVGVSFDMSELSSEERAERVKECFIDYVRAGGWIEVDFLIDLRQTNDPNLVHEMGDHRTKQTVESDSRDLQPDELEKSPPAGRTRDREKKEEEVELIGKKLPYDPIYDRQSQPHSLGTNTKAADGRICIIGGGVDHAHIDLISNIYVNNRKSNGQENSDDDGNGFIDDHGWNSRDNSGDISDVAGGFGTAAAGMMDARGNKRLGMTGIEWQQEIVSCKFSDNSGKGWLSDVIKCMNYCGSVDASIYLFSFSFRPPHGVNTPANLSLAILRAREHNVLVVAPGGDEGLNIDVDPVFPAALSHDNLLTVMAAHLDSGMPAHLANWGKNRIDVAGPGGVDKRTAVDGGGYDEWRGSELAAAATAGLAGMLRQAGGESYQYVKALIISTVTPSNHLALQNGSGGVVSRRNAVRRMKDQSLWIRLAEKETDFHIGAGEQRTIVFSEMPTIEGQFEGHFRITFLQDTEPNPVIHDVPIRLTIGAYHGFIPPLPPPGIIPIPAIPLMPPPPPPPPFIPLPSYQGFLDFIRTTKKTNATSTTPSMTTSPDSPANRSNKGAIGHFGGGDTTTTYSKKPLTVATTSWASSDGPTSLVMAVTIAVFATTLAL